MFTEEQSITDNLKNEAVKTIQQPGHLSNLFFSKQNVDYIQGRIQSEVYRLSNGRHRIGRQSDTELSIVMRSIYLQFSRNSPDDIRGQILDLDNRVINECVPGILTGIEQYLKYRVDASTMYKPVELPEAISTKGEKSLEYKPFF
jgi:hypothetical protein